MIILKDNFPKRESPATQVQQGFERSVTEHKDICCFTKEAYNNNNYRGKEKKP
jgi:hypothetical protein